MASHPNRRRTATALAPAHDHENEYPILVRLMTASFMEKLSANTALFKTDTEGLFNAYLNNMPSDQQVHTCSACRTFMKKYGTLVCVGEDGQLIPLVPEVSDAIPGFYHASVAAMHTAVSRSKIKGVFQSDEAGWYGYVTDNNDPAYVHFTVPHVPAHHIYKGRKLSARQDAAARNQSYKTVAQALGEIKPVVVAEALRLFENKLLNRSDLFAEPVRWIQKLQNRPRGRLGENLLWQAVATAPEGFLHIKSGMIGNLFEEIAAGKPFEVIRRNFAVKTSALNFQRAQVAPSVGNIKTAENLVAKLGVAKSLERRYARFDELELSWTPKAQPVPEGVFGHLKAKDDPKLPSMQLPPVVMTWVKFKAEVLPKAEKMKLLVPHAGPFISLTTGVHADAPLIFKWNNPVCWYVYPEGSEARRWGLSSNTFVDVTGITSLPTMWGDKPQPFLGEGMIFLLAGCKDALHQGNSLFSECLHNDFHEIRSTVEAYSKAANLSGMAEASASGYDLRKERLTPVQVNVCMNGVWNRYTIDRWD